MFHVKKKHRYIMKCLKVMYVFFKISIILLQILHADRKHFWRKTSVFNKYFQISKNTRTITVDQSCQQKSLACRIFINQAWYRSILWGQQPYSSARNWLSERSNASTKQHRVFYLNSPRGREENKKSALECEWRVYIFALILVVVVAFFLFSF